MTVMAVPEAVSAGEAAGARVIQGRATTVREERIGRRRPKRARSGTARSAARQYGGQAAGAYAAQGRHVAQNARVPGDRSYQPVILAEFMIAVVIITLTPIATGGSEAAQAKNSPSPYDAKDLTQLVAVGGVYFVLSLISSGNRGRISAWLGGLIVIGLAMTKMAGPAKSLFTAAPKVTPANPADQQGWGADPFGNAPATDGGGGSKNPEAA